MTYMVGSLLIGADEKIAEYVSRKTGTTFKDYTAIGVVRRNVLVGGVVYHMFREGNCEVSIAFDSPQWALPGTLRGLFDYPFNQLNCHRMTALIAKKNKRSRKLTEGLGFKLEGVLRRGIGGRDAMIYGMLKDECRWLGKKNG